MTRPVKYHVELGTRTLHLEIVAARLFDRATIAEAVGQYAVLVSTEEIYALAADLRHAADQYRAAHSRLITTGNV